MEKPSGERYLLFLDIEFKITEHDMITNRWFQKPIHSLNLLHKKSATLETTKMNVTVNMFMIAILNSNTYENINYSINKMKTLLEKNEYTYSDIEKCAKRAIYKINLPVQRKMFEMERFIKVLIISKNTQIAIQKLLMKNNFQTMRIINTK